MGMAEIEFIRTWAVHMFVILIIFGIVGVFVHLLLTYKDVFKKNKWLRMVIPVGGVGLFSALVPYFVVLQPRLDELLTSVVENPYDFDFAHRTLGFPWRLILWIRGAILNRIYIVGICIVTGIAAYFLAGLIVFLIHKIRKAF